MEYVNPKVSCHLQSPEPGIIFLELIPGRNNYIHKKLHPKYFVPLI